MTKMKIDNSQTKAIFEFSPADYFLVLQERYKNQPKEWSLNYRVDRSEKGKDDDIGEAIIYLSEKEADICKENGFSYIEL